MPLLILYFFIAIFFSFICSIFEAVILSMSPSYITISMEEKSPLSKYLLVIRDNIDRPLSAILTLNTFAHTLGAAGVGVQAQKLWGNEYLSLVSAVLTILILILSEIIPKTLGATYWKGLAPYTLPLIKVITLILYPFVFISSLVTNLLKSREKGQTFSRSDLVRMAEAIRKEGSINKGESNIIQNLLHLNTLKISDIMTPRTIIRALAEDHAINTLRKDIDSINYSRIPLYAGDLDHITGFILRDDLLQALMKKKNNSPVKSLKREILAVSSGSMILRVLESFIETHAHIAVAIDEYGGTAGIVTLEDIMESLLGKEIIDETDSVTDLQKEARKQNIKKFK